MMKRNLPLMFFRLFCIALSLWGMNIAFGVYAVARQSTLFANWSCLLSVVVWLLLVWKPDRFAVLQGMVAMCGLLTMFMFQFILPLYHAPTRTAWQRVADIVLRAGVPLLMLADFLFLRPRKPLKKSAPWIWTIFPVIYFLCALMLPVLREFVWSKLPKYPYFFLNPNGMWILEAKQGMTGVWLNAAAMFAVYVLFGHMIMGVYHRKHSAVTYYRILAAMLALYGELGAFGILDGKIQLNALCYFTHLSNLLCLVTWILLLRRPGGFARVQSFATQAILMTMVVYHSVLNDFDFRLQSVAQFNDHVVHTFVPLLMAADFLFIRKRVRLPKKIPLKWTLMPAGYLCYALLMPALKRTVFPDIIRYPYFFMDPDESWILSSPQGTEGVFLNCLVIAVVYILAGYGVYGVYTWRCIRHEKAAARKIGGEAAVGVIPGADVNNP